MSVFAEYIWIDGSEPTRQLRSKTKVLPADFEVPTRNGYLDASVFSDWGADGSSTYQATGGDSDIDLRPVCAVRDPWRENGYLVLTETYGRDGEPLSSNRRSWLRRILDMGGAQAESWFGFEQEYTMFKTNGTPLGFPDGGYPRGQGPYYCGVGAGNVVGREVYDEVLVRCTQAGLAISGANLEVMPGQAEIQIGAAPDLVACDHVWLARWVLHRVGEDHGVVINLEAKPVKGDWNGAGMHTNFSTRAMRDEGGLEVIQEACEKIGRKREEHLAVYGHDYQSRLTGHHETASFRDFKYGIADRTASIRIPRHVGRSGRGYLEDRRPNCNADPYEVAARLLQTVLDLD
jgi:glutamine synthetase